MSLQACGPGRPRHAHVKEPLTNGVSTPEEDRIHGWATVNRPNLHDELALDLFYIKNRNLKLTLLILWHRQKGVANESDAIQWCYVAANFAHHSRGSRASSRGYEQSRLFRHQHQAGST